MQAHRRPAAAAPASASADTKHTCIVRGCPLSKRSTGPPCCKPKHDRHIWAAAVAGAVSHLASHAIPLLAPQLGHNVPHIQALLWVLQRTAGRHRQQLLDNGGQLHACAYRNLPLAAPRLAKPVCPACSTGLLTSPQHQCCGHPPATPTQTAAPGLGWGSHTPPGPSPRAVGCDAGQARRYQCQMSRARADKSATALLLCHPAPHRWLAGSLCLPLACLQWETVLRIPNPASLQPAACTHLLVLAAPLVISPLCCRMRRRGLTVKPM